MPIPDNVRLYYFSSTQHGPTDKPDRGMCQQLTNPLSYMETQRALIVALHAWVSKDVPFAPAHALSTNFRRNAGIAAADCPGFPNVPGVRYLGRPNDLSINDGTIQPANHVKGKEYPLLVPKVDKDGNEIAGVRAVALQMPLATHSG